MNSLVGERVYVYRNLHRKCYSVRSTKTGRVICHVDRITLSDVKFRVGQAGREKVLKTKQKNVHAGVVGFIVDLSDTPLLYKFIRVSYNPYKYTSFVRYDESPIGQARIAIIDAHGIMAVE